MKTLHRKNSWLLFFKTIEKTAQFPNRTLEKFLSLFFLNVILQPKRIILIFFNFTTISLIKQNNQDTINSINIIFDIYFLNENQKIILFFGYWAFYTLVTFLLRRFKTKCCRIWLFFFFLHKKTQHRNVYTTPKRSVLLYFACFARTLWWKKYYERKIPTYKSIICFYYFFGAFNVCVLLLGLLFCCCYFPTHTFTKCPQNNFFFCLLFFFLYFYLFIFSF